MLCQSYHDDVEDKSSSDISINFLVLKNCISCFQSNHLQKIVSPSTTNGIPFLNSTSYQSHMLPYRTSTGIHNPSYLSYAVQEWGELPYGGEAFFLYKCIYRRSFAHQIFKMIVSHTNWLFYTSIIFTTVAIVNIESFI